MLWIIYALKNTTAKDRQLLEDAINNADNSKIKQEMQAVIF
jgi:hypothetical protein